MWIDLSAAMLCPCCKSVFERCERCPSCGEVAHIAIESLADGVVEAVQEQIWMNTVG